MGVSRYVARGKVRWRVDAYVALPDGATRRIRKKRIPTREQAEAWERKMLVEAYEGRFFDRVKESTATVRELWSEYEPITKRDNDSWRSDVGRAVHLVRLLADRRASRLTRGDVEEYRTTRQGEITQRGGAPTPATLDREIELLKRLLNFAVSCGKLPANPLAHVKLLRVPNVRRVVLDEEAFQRFHQAAEAWLRPILLVAFDTGMRKSEVLNLRWSQLDLRAGAVRLEAEDTKTDEPRVVYLTDRVLAALADQPRLLHADYVFVNPATGKPWQDVQGAVERARERAGLQGVWVHEPKWDGFRCLAFVARGEVDLRSRHGRPFTRYFPELVAALARLGDAVLDGEVVVGGASGLDFAALLCRIHPAASRVERLARETPASYVAFDLLAAGGEDLAARPLVERRARLEALLAAARPPLLTPATLDRDTAQAWLDRFHGRGIDGVVAKALDGPYEPGRRGWVKVKRERTADCVVAGFRTYAGEPLVASLLLGLWDAAGALVHVGVSSSFPDRALPPPGALRALAAGPRPALLRARPARGGGRAVEPAGLRVTAAPREVVELEVEGRSLRLTNLSKPLGASRSSRRVT